MGVSWRSFGGLDLVEPGDKVVRHLVAVRFVQRLVPGARIDPGREPGEARRLQVADEALDVGSNRIALAGEDIDRQILAERREACRVCDVWQRVEHIDGKLGREREAAE